MPQARAGPAPLHDKDAVLIFSLASRHRFGAQALVAASLGLVASASAADTVLLANGDRLSGTVQLLDAGTLLLKTSYAGEIRIAWKHVVQIETDDPLVLHAPGLPAGYQARLLPATRDGQALQLAATPESSEAPAPQPIALDQVERLVRPHPVLRDWVFKGNADLALDANHAAKTNENWTLALQSTLRRYNWRHGLTANYTRKSQDSVVGTHNYMALYTLDRFVTEKLFVQGRVRYRHDYIDDPARDLSFAVGPGYQFWDNELGALSVSTLVNHTRYRYHDGDTVRFQSLGVSWDYSRYFGGKQWQLFSHGEVYQALSNDADQSLDVAIGMRYSLTEWLSLYTKASYNRVTASGQDNSSERKYSVGLSTRW